MASEAGGPARLAAIGSPSAGHEGFTSPAPLACGLRLGNFADRRGTVVVLHLSTRGIRDGRNVPRHRKFSCSQNEPKRENRDNCVSVLADAHKFCNGLTHAAPTSLLWRSRKDCRFWTACSSVPHLSPA